MRFAIVIVLLTARPVFATKYDQPKRHDVFSRNRNYVLNVNPETKVHTVYHMQDRTKPLWSFSKPVWHYPFLLSDDGTVVVTVAWKHVKAEDIGESDGVQFWRKDGLFRSYPLADLCPNPPKTQDVGIGPIGEFWRTWYRDVKDHGNGFVLQTTCGVEYDFRYRDGELLKHHWFGSHGWGGWWLVVGGMATLGVTGIAIWRLRSRRRNLRSRPGRYYDFS